MTSSVILSVGRAVFMLVRNDSHLVFIYVMIISIIILNSRLAARRPAFDWDSVTTGNGDNSNETVILAAGPGGPGLPSALQPPSAGKF